MPEEQRFVLGIAYQAGPDPRIKRGVDGGRDWFSKAELERACWSYMRSGCPQVNAFHVDGTEDCAEPVESFIWRWDDWDVGDGIVVKDGDWCVGAVLSPRMWELYKAGEINGFSPEGTATRRRVQKEGAVTLTKGSDEVAETTDEDGDFSELVNANVPKMALVGQGANGIPRFLMSKQEGAAGLFDPAYVRNLVAKSEPEAEAAYAGETVTMSGSPAAIAALIHGAPVRKAQPDADLTKQADATTPEDAEVTKDMDDMPMDDEGGMDPTIVLAEPGQDAPGSPADPGSPAWEGIDAATARKWTAIAARLRSALAVMSDREMLEAATIDPSDAENACDLDDAAMAVDYVISVLAAFAVDEQAEADDAVMATVGKSIGALDVAHLDTVESLGAVRKAGRTLSGANESALRAAIQALQQILASLPTAPVMKEAGEPALAKTANEEPNMPEPTLTEDVTATSGQQPAMGAASPEPKPVAGMPVTEMAKAADEPAPAAQPVAKADKPPQVAVYDANGNLVGVADPADITMIAAAKAPDANTDDATPEEPAPAAEATDAPPTDLAPAPPASVGTPADAVPADDDTVAKAADTTKSNEAQDVLKSSIQELVKAAIDEQGARQGELVKSLEDRNQALEERNEALAKQSAELNERLTAVENQPAVMAIATNGATPSAHQMRGQDYGATRVDVTKGAQLRTAFKASDDARQQKVLAEDMNLMAIEKLREIHSAGPR